MRQSRPYEYHLIHAVQGIAVEVRTKRKLNVPAIRRQHADDIGLASAKRFRSLSTDSRGTKLSLPKDSVGRPC